MLGSAACIAALLAGCSSSPGGGSDNGSGQSGSPGSSSAPAPTDGGDSISGLLALAPPVPADDLGVVGVTRWHAAADAYGVDVPETGASKDELMEYLRALTVEGGIVGASDLMDVTTASSMATEDDFGYFRQQIAADISVGQPPRRMHAARGEFDPDRIAEATRAGTVGPDVEEVEVAGVPVLRWREDFEARYDQLTALSRIGSSGRLAAPDNRTLLYAAHDDGIADLIEAAGGGESLADDPDLGPIAEELDAHDVLATQLMLRPDGSKLAYTAVGVGYAWDGSGRMVLVYSTESEEDSESVAEDVETLVTTGSTLGSRQPWSELLTDPEFAVDGRMVTATFGLEKSLAWAAFVQQRETLF
jgi:hypothetical protein